MERNYRSLVSLMKIFFIFDLEVFVKYYGSYFCVEFLDKVTIWVCKTTELVYWPIHFEIQRKVIF